MPFFPGITFHPDNFTDADFAHDAALACKIRHDFSQSRPWFNDAVLLDDAGPNAEAALPFSAWTQPARLAALLDLWQQHIYRQQPGAARLEKPLISLWAQWYLGLLVPPLMQALLTQPAALHIAPEYTRVEFHATGRAARFFISVYTHPNLSEQPARQRLELLCQTGIAPVINALTAGTERAHARLIWSNTGYLMHWFLGELRPQLGDEAWQALRHALFLEPHFSDSTDNPLFRSVIPRNGLLMRRTCCQRNRLPGVQQCGDCTLK